MNIKTRFVALSSLAFLLLTGCAGFNPGKHDQNAAFASEDLGELLHFGSDLANMAEPSRAEVSMPSLA
jgi:outer membrane biogenesis lipoprotein LolB